MAQKVTLKGQIRFEWVKHYSDKTQQVASCLSFFGVASVEVWEEKWMQNLAAFRSSKIKENQKGTVAAWIRQCECNAQTIICKPFDPHKFKEVLQIVKRLTKDDKVEQVIQELTRLCAEAGVALSLVPTPKGCPAHGPTCWLGPDKALLMLSDRYKSNNQFWFSFFHEAAHILYHAKKVVFIETVGPLGTEEEEEANRFAANILIPPELAGCLKTIPKNSHAIKKFAKDLDIGPGIIVGRMQRERLLPWKTNLNSLKKKVGFI